MHLPTISLSPKPVWRDQIALDSFQHMALLLKMAELMQNASWFPWQSFLYIIFISPQFSWRGEKKKRKKIPKTKPPWAFQKTQALSVLLLHWRTAENRNVVSVKVIILWWIMVYTVRYPTWVFMHKDTNSYSKSRVPTSSTKPAQHQLLHRVSFATLKRNCPTNIPWSLRGTRR